MKQEAAQQSKSEPGEGEIRLLSSQEYQARFQSAQTAMHRSLLVLLGLMAFWLAMESNYVQFSTLYMDSINLESLKRNLERARNRLDWLNRLPVLDEKDIAEKLQLEKELANEATPKRIDRYDEDVRELDRSAITFSITGTTLAARLTYAPTVWFVVLTIWMMYFAVRRAGALRNAGAYRLAFGETGPPFGGIGEGSLWFASLPDAVFFRTSGAEVGVVDKNDLSWCLGWTAPATNLRYRFFLIFLALILIGIELRILWIAADVTGHFSLSRGAISLSGHYIGLGIPSLLFAVSTLQLAVWLLHSKNLEASTLEGPDVVRRQLLTGGAAFAGAVAFTWYRDNLLQPLARVGLLTGDVASRIGTRADAPRFIPMAQRERRLARFRVFEKREPAATFFARLRKGRGKRRYVVHYADSTAQVRFFSSTISGVQNLEALEGSEAADLKWLEENHVKSVRTWQWEAAALDKLESGQIENACRLLRAGIMLDMGANGPPKNVRLVHLLVGLSTRYKAHAPYRDEIEKVVGDREEGRWARTLEKWRDPNSNWHQRWSGEAPVWWHHPMQTREFSWKRSRKMEPTPPNPEIRQRPVKIA